MFVHLAQHLHGNNYCTVTLKGESTNIVLVWIIVSVTWSSSYVVQLYAERLN